MTEPTEFSPARSDAIRAELVDVVDQRPVSGGRRLGAAVGLVLAGVLVGGGAATAAAAIWDRSPSPAPSYGISVTTQEAPPGVPVDTVFPGQPTVVLLGGPIVFPVDEAEHIVDLAPPEGATHVRISVTCTERGTISWAVGQEGGSFTCSVADLSSQQPPIAWSDVDLSRGGSLVVQTRDGATSIVSLQYLRVVETAWGVNEGGETFGVTKPGEGDPDLIAAQGFDPDGNVVTGYVRSGDLEQQCPGAAPPTSPEQALEQQERCQRDYPNGFDIPLYESDGVTRVGVFRVGG